jgi:hypothetical protein
MRKNMQYMQMLVFKNQKAEKILWFLIFIKLKYFLLTGIIPGKKEY